MCIINEVFVLTKAEPFQKEEYVDVFISEDVLVKYLKKISQYLKKDGDGQYHITDKGETILYFCHKSIVKK